MVSRDLHAESARATGHFEVVAAVGTAARCWRPNPSYRITPEGALVLSMDALNTEMSWLVKSIDNFCRGSAAGQRQAKRRRHVLLRRVACFLHVESVLASRWMPPVRGKHVHGRVPSN